MADGQSKEGVLVFARQELSSVLFNIFISHLDDEVEYTLSKSMDSTILVGVPSAAIQRDLGRWRGGLTKTS